MYLPTPFSFKKRVLGRFGPPLPQKKWFGLNSESLDVVVSAALPLAGVSGPLWAPPAQSCSSPLAAPATGWRTSRAIWRDAGREACLRSLGARVEVSFGRWWWSPCGRICVGSGQTEGVAGVCGLAEAKAKAPGKGSYPRTRWCHQNVPGARSRSSGLPRCTAGRAGQHLGGAGGGSWMRNRIFGWNTESKAKKM